MKTPKVVFRIGKLKSWGEIGAAAGHNLRARPTPNAGPGGFVEIVPLEGPAPAAVRSKIGDQTIRKNAVLAVEIIVSASPEFFRPDAPEQAGKWDESQLEQWREAMEPWIKDKFPHAVSVVLHLDEATPHYQIIDVPLDEKGKLNCRGKFGGKETLIQWQDEAARAVADLGIERGIAGSAAKHTRIKAYYEAVNTPAPAIPPVSTPKPAPLPPRSMAESLPMTDAKKLRDDLEAEHAAQVEQRNAEKAQQQKAILKAWPAVVKRSNAVDMERARREQAEATAARAARMKADADRLRALPVDQVLRRMYGAELDKGSKDTHRSRKYLLADGRKLAVTPGNTGADVWVEQGEKGQKGAISQRGAINLVMYLDGVDYKGALRMLAEHFDPHALASEHARTLVARATREVESIKAAPMPAPAPAPAQWPRVRQWLEEVRGMPRKLIDHLHDLGLLYADARANATFKRASGGAFQRGTGDVRFHRAIGGADCGPFVIPGTSKKVILVEAPLDAMAVKAVDGTATVIASGGDMLRPEMLKQWIAEGSEVLAGHDADTRGEQLAKTATMHLQAKRFKPSCKDWAESIQKEPWRIDAQWRDDAGTEGEKPAPRPTLRGPR